MSVRSLACVAFAGAFLASGLVRVVHAAVTCPVTPPLSESEVSFETIQQRLGAQATSAAVVLACLPDSYKKNFALMRDSRSMQSGTSSAPRVILYGKDARTMIAFNGETPGNIEIIQYGGTPPKFSPREITFAASGPPSYDAQPSSCQGCHGDGNAFRPVWDSYDIWPGAYGSLSANGADMMPESECADYQRFIASASGPATAQLPANSPYRGLHFQPVKKGKDGKTCFFNGQGDGSRGSPTGHHCGAERPQPPRPRARSLRRVRRLLPPDG